MKEFEKWYIVYKQQEGGVGSYWLDGFWSVGQSDKTAKAGWKAALEWGLELNSVRVCDNVYEDIKRELDATSEKK